MKEKTANLVCVLGAAGGGRDKWKRKEFGRIASEFCDHVILTNEDPYDEDLDQIMSEIESGISKLQFSISKKIDRREAIQEALRNAKNGDVVVLSGKGSEEWIMGPRGTKVPWNEKQVVKEELKKISPGP